MLQEVCEVRAPTNSLEHTTQVAERNLKLQITWVGVSARQPGCRKQVSEAREAGFCLGKSPWGSTEHPTPGREEGQSGNHRLGRNLHGRRYNLRTNILSRSSNAKFLREGTTPCKALRGVSAPERPEARRLNSMPGGRCQGHDALSQEEPTHQDCLLFTGALAQGHGDLGAPIPVPRVKVARLDRRSRTEGAGACAHKGRQTLGSSPSSWADLWALPPWAELPPWGGEGTLRSH